MRKKLSLLACLWVSLCGCDKGPAGVSTTTGGAATTGAATGTSSGAAASSSAASSTAGTSGSSSGGTSTGGTSGTGGSSSSGGGTSGSSGSSTGWADAGPACPLPSDAGPNAIFGNFDWTVPLQAVESIESEGIGQSYFFGSDGPTFNVQVSDFYASCLVQNCTGNRPCPDAGALDGVRNSQVVTFMLEMTDDAGTRYPGTDPGIYTLVPDAGHMGPNEKHVDITWILYDYGCRITSYENFAPPSFVTLYGVADGGASGVFHLKGAQGVQAINCGRFGSVDCAAYEPDNAYQGCAAH